MRTAPLTFNIKNANRIADKRFDDKKLLWGSILIGLLCSGLYFYWWFEQSRIQHPAFLAILGLALIYYIVQVLFHWFIFLHIKFPKLKQAKEGLSIDVFIPTYNEPLWLVERTVSAALAINYPHKTYLIDDSQAGSYRQLAESLGANYISRSGNKDNKAGNINAALKQTDSDFVAIFDIDHIPDQSFLDRSLGYFSSPKIGFVQVMLNHYNQNESYVAAAGAKRNDSFFGPSMLGLNGLGCAQAFGSNCIFRRQALESIGGYIPGLAEDVNTSINLHAKGWQSAYVPESLAKGLEPIDVSGFFKQQFKWSMGIFSTLFQIYPKFIGKLSWKMNIGYLWRLTCYLAGPAVALHIFFLVLTLFNSSTILDVHFASYLTHSAPFMIMLSGISYIADKKYSILNSDSKNSLSGLFIAFGTWPIYTFSFICAALHIKIPYIPTPKEGTGSVIVKLILSQIITIGILVIGVAFKLYHSLTMDSMIICSFAFVIILLHWGLFHAVWDGWNLPSQSNYKVVNIPGEIDKF